MIQGEEHTLDQLDLSILEEALFSSYESLVPIGDRETTQDAVSLKTDDHLSTDESQVPEDAGDFGGRRSVVWVLSPASLNEGHHLRCNHS